MFYTLGFVLGISDLDYGTRVPSVGSLRLYQNLTTVWWRLIATACSVSSVAIVIIGPRVGRAVVKNSSEPKILRSPRPRKTATDGSLRVPSPGGITDPSCCQRLEGVKQSSGRQEMSNVEAGTFRFLSGGSDVGFTE